MKLSFWLASPSRLARPAWFPERPAVPQGVGVLTRVPPVVDRFRSGRRVSGSWQVVLDSSGADKLVVLRFARLDLNHHAVLTPCCHFQSWSLPKQAVSGQRARCPCRTERNTKKISSSTWSAHFWKLTWWHVIMACRNHRYCCWTQSCYCSMESTLCLGLRSHKFGLQIYLWQEFLLMPSGREP